MRFLVFLIALLVSDVGIGQLSDVDTQALSHKNLLDKSNPGFENGIVKWTASDAATFSLETASPIFGSGAGSFDADSISDTIESAAVSGLSGLQCLVKFYYQYNGTAGDYTVTVHDSSDNDLILDTDGAVFDLADTDGATRSFEAGFPCDSGAMNIQIASTSASSGDLVVDGAWLGQDYRIGKAAGGDVIIEAYYPATSNCNWQRTNTATGAFSADSDCSPMTVNYDKLGLVDVTEDDIPNLILTNAPAGKYLVQVSASIDMSTSSTVFAAISDGTDTKGAQACSGGSTTDACPVSLLGLFEYTSAGDRTFAVHGGSSAAGTIALQNSPTDKVTQFTVTYYPPSVDTVTLETQGFFVNAEITKTSGTSVGFGLTTDSAFEEATDVSLQIEALSGSAAVEIPCASGTASEGTTCNAAAVNEAMGVVFSIPRGGYYEACAQWNWETRLDGAEAISSYVKLAETSNTSDTITQDVATPIFNSWESFQTNNVMYDSQNHCHIFNWTSSGQKTIRLFEYTVISGVPDVNGIYFDSTRDSQFRITVKPLTQNFPQAVALTGYKWQRRALTSSFTTDDADIPGLTFSNLTVGKTYRVSANISWTRDEDDSNAGIQIFDEASGAGNQLARIITSRADQTDAATLRQQSSQVFIYTATTGNIYFHTSSFGAGSTVHGSTDNATTVTVEELPGWVETNEWTP